MDTEEAREIALAKLNGHPHTDEGPYYHTTGWEGYKGAIKGLLGGLIIGAGIGLLIGAPIAGALLLSGVAEAGTALLTGAAFAAGGMIFGAHEFSNVWREAGALAAAHETQEARMKEYLNEKIAPVTAQLKEIKTALTGKLSDADPALVNEELNKAQAKELREGIDYRTTHCDEQHCPPKDRVLYYTKIGIAGALIGAAAAAMAVLGGLDTALLHLFGGAAEAALHPLGIAAPIAVGASIGASFGINRDIFREVFDTTDLWFKGIFTKKDRESGQQLHSYEVVPDRLPPHKPNVIVEPAKDAPTLLMPEPERSPTHHQDKVMTAARKALYELNPNAARMQ